MQGAICNYEGIFVELDTAGVFLGIQIAQCGSQYWLRATDMLHIQKHIFEDEQMENWLYKTVVQTEKYNFSG